MTEKIKGNLTVAYFYPSSGSTLLVATNPNPHLGHLVSICDAFVENRKNSPRKTQRLFVL
jgi:hypothetical protein